MFLNDRKMKILEAIITDYIQTAEPIGSRTIAKKYDLGISSATVRNEMSDLEELGLIVQPHASAGRVPSDKGYRYFVDSMMLRRELDQEQQAFLRNIVINNMNQIDFLMEEIAKSIAVLTNYTTIISEPQFAQTKVKHIQLVPVDESSIVVVLVTDSKKVKNSIVRLEKTPDYETLLNLTFMLNDNLAGYDFSSISQIIASDMIKKYPQVKTVLEPILNAVLSIIELEDNTKIYTSGVKNILGFPEFSNVEKAKAIFQTLEEKETLVTILGNETRDEIQIIIGSENKIEQLKDLSLIKANYKIGNNNFGQIGIIGPTRMDYTQAVSVLGTIVKNLNSALDSLSGG